MDKDKIIIAVIAALVGTTGGGGTATAFLGQHAHPEIIKEIREVQYDGEIFKLTTQLEAMEKEGLKDSPAYAVIHTQLMKFTQMRTELGK